MSKINMKFVLAIMLAALMCLMGAALADEVDYTFIYEVLDDGTARIMGTREPVYGDLIIPEKVDDYTVTQIGAEAFCYTQIKSVVMPDTVTEMGTSAFYGCYDLKSAVLSKNLQAIPAGAFEDCGNLKQVNIPASVKEIGEWAFAWTDLGDVVIPEGVEIIRYAAFEESDIRSVSLPNGLKEMAEGVFSGCNDLADVKLPEDMQVIPKYTFYDCDKLEKITFPEELKEIREWAFAYSAIKTAIFPEGIERINSYAFHYTELDVAVIPASASALGEHYNEDEYYTEHDAIFTYVDKLYVVKGSAGQAYAEKYGMDYILYGAENPKIADVECSAGVCANTGDTVEWTVCGLGSDDLQYFMLIYRDGHKYNAYWQGDNVFTCDIEEAGSYTAKFMVKTPDGRYSDYVWAKPFDAVEDLPEVPVVSDFVLYTPDTITLDTPIMWSYRLRGGSGDFSDGVNRSYSLIFDDGESDDLYALDWHLWNEPGGAYIRASYIPRETGVYTLILTPEDSEGAQAEQIVFPEITVKENSFRITEVTSDLKTFEMDAFEGDYGSYEAQTVRYALAGEEVTWNVKTEGATGEVVYTVQVVGYSPSDGYDTILKQSVSTSPEFSYTFENDAAWSNRICITAYDPGTDSIAIYRGDEFQVCDEESGYLPFEWYIEYYYDIASDEETGEVIFNLESYIDCYDERFYNVIGEKGYKIRFDLYRDGEFVSTSGETDATSWTCSARGSGSYTLKLSVLDGEEIVALRETDPIWVNPDHEFGDFYTENNYSEFDMTTFGWDLSFWHESEALDCYTDNCEHLQSRFTLYRDGEALETTDWSTEHTYQTTVDEYGEYRALVEAKNDEDVVVFSEMTGKIVFNEPAVTSIINGAGHANGVWTGQYIGWEIYGEGGMQADRNSVKAVIYRNGEVYKTCDWREMEAVENYDYGGWHSFACINDAVTAPGTYVMEAWMKDEKGVVSDGYRSGEVFVADYRTEALTIESVGCDWKSLDINAGRAIQWQALAFGGSGELSYNFELLCDGSFMAGSGWQNSNAYTFVPEITGAYSVRVSVKDAAGNTAGPVTSRTVAVLNAAENTVLDIDVSAGEIYACVGDRFMVDMVLIPEGVKADVLYETTDPKVAKVTDEGLITIVGEGDAEVVLYADDSLGTCCDLIIHAGGFNVAAVPASVTLIDAEAFDGSGFAGLDLTGTSGAVLAEDALSGSMLRCVYLADDTVIENGAFGDCPAVIFCANRNQTTAAAAAGADYVMVD